MPRLSALVVLMLIALLNVSCSDDVIEAEATSVPTTTNATTTPETTTTAPATTTTTAPATTTTVPATTTTEPENEGGWGVVVGDCFNKAGSDGATPTKVPCDEPHYGEVFATISSKGSVGSDGIARPPDPDAVRAEILAHLSDYVGVETAEVLDWLPEQSIAAVFTERTNFDESGVVSADMLCSLIAEEGDLTRSYRSG